MGRSWMSMSRIPPDSGATSAHWSRERLTCRHCRRELCVALFGQLFQLLPHGGGQGDAPPLVLEVGPVAPLAGVEYLLCIPGEGRHYYLHSGVFAVHAEAHEDARTKIFEFIRIVKLRAVFHPA